MHVGDTVKTPFGEEGTVTDVRGTTCTVEIDGATYMYDEYELVKLHFPFEDMDESILDKETPCYSIGEMVCADGSTVIYEIINIHYSEDEQSFYYELSDGISKIIKEEDEISLTEIEIEEDDTVLEVSSDKTVVATISYISNDNKYYIKCSMAELYSFVKNKHTFPGLKTFVNKTGKCIPGTERFDSEDMLYVEHAVSLPEPSVGKRVWVYRNKSWGKITRPSGARYWAIKLEDSETSVYCGNDEFFVQAE